jgi:ABC-type bacteriocin/lantibiotic exporter with double-glycine peptidase domain
LKLQLAVKRRILGFTPQLLKACLFTFSKQDRRKILFIALLQTVLNLLDLVGVAIIGIIGSLAVSGLQSIPPAGRVYSILQFLNIDELSLQAQTVTLGFIATFFLILRTATSILVTRRTLRFLSIRAALLTGTLSKNLLSQDIIGINSKTTQETLYTLTRGADSIALGIIGTLITAISDLSLLLFMIASLVMVDPIVALISILVFSAAGFGLYYFLQVKAKNLGNQITQQSISVNEQISEFRNAFREIYTKHREDFYASSITNKRKVLASANAELSFLPSISKYLLEGIMTLGVLLIAALQFVTHDARHAVGTLTLFLAAASRIAPAIMRLQQGALQIRSSQVSAEMALELLNKKIMTQTSTERKESQRGNGDVIHISNLTFTYPGKNSPAVNNVSLKIREGDFVAIVGPSGSGKSTLMDLLLGVINPTFGSVLLNNESPQTEIRLNPDTVGYVPQDVFLSNSTLRENLEFGFKSGTFQDNELYEVLDTVQLGAFARNLPGGIDANLGEGGSGISGGQRQRLGLARALLTKPQILFLDEATSALDAKTERDISESISKLKGKLTIVAIAHRLSTVQAADKIYYLKNGKVLNSGTFEEIRRSIPEFDEQASIMGL